MAEVFLSSSPAKIEVLTWNIYLHKRFILYDFLRRLQFWGWRIGCCFHILNGRLNSVALTRIGEWNCTVWYFCTMAYIMLHFNVFSKDAWHSVILQQFYNKQKRYFAERKTKTSGLWILDTGLILEGICIGISDEIRSEAVNLYLLLNKIWRWSKIYFVILSFVIQYRWCMKRYLQSSNKEKNILDYGWCKLLV